MLSFREQKSDCITSRRFVRIVGSIMLVLMLLMSCDVYEQSGSGIYTLTGRIADENDNSIAGVKVYIEGGKKKAVTDSSGKFSISDVPGHTVTLVAENNGKILVPTFDSNKIMSNGNSINVEYSTDSWVVEGCDFLQVDRVTIPMIQGTGDMSPLNGVHVDDVIGVVTQVCFEQRHNNPNFTTPDPSHGKSNPQVISNDGFYMQLLPNCNVSGLAADGNNETSDGIFVSTRDPKGRIATSKWLSSCKIDGRYPQPGDIVRVSGTVVEHAIADRFGESRGLNTRTQIDAISVERDVELVTEGKIKIEDKHLLKMTYESLGESFDQDSFRTLPFDDEGVDALNRASRIFESCEGMLVRIENPIVVGATYYNTTPILADGGKKTGVNPENEGYPSQFNKKWMAPVVQENDFNTEILHVYYDSLDRFDALPQIGTVLTDDAGNEILRGVVDYNDNGFYMVYPMRVNNLKTDKEIYNPLGTVDCSHLDFKLHNDLKFKLNTEAPMGSLYNLNDARQQEWVNLGMTDAQNSYKPWKSGTFCIDEFVVPWNSDDSHMSVGVFNLENFTGEGSKYSKYADVVNVIVNNLKCPDLIFIVEMGDHDDSEDTIIYNNSSYSQTNMTGVVSARLNFETLIKKIYKQTNLLGSAIQYDYRQIDPVEYTQAGKPGANIRVGFMFRTDRVEAYDLGLPTVHMYETNENGLLVPYKIPKNLLDGHSSIVFGSNGVESPDDPSPRKPEPDLTLETKKVLAETQTEILGVYDEDGKLVDTTLSQSPGFLQDGRFYNSRLPLVCKFKFKPTGEDFYGIALHLYSKGRDDKLYGNIQPPVMTSEIRRAGQSIAVKEFIDEILDLDPDAKIIVGGDVNDFGFTYPIKKMTGEGTDNQVLYDISSYYMPENERFTYTFNGNLQQLDHVFVSPAIYERMGSPVAPTVYVDPTDNAANSEWKQHVFVPHVNSLFSRDRHIQISDHDPIAARIDM